MTKEELAKRLDNALSGIAYLRSEINRQRSCVQNHMDTSFDPNEMIRLGGMSYGHSRTLRILDGGCHCCEEYLRLEDAHHDRRDGGLYCETCYNERKEG